VWLKIAKKGSGVPSLTADEAVDVGLCYGWISGQRSHGQHHGKTVAAHRGVADSFKTVGGFLG
jgi:hypothetical protein